MTIELTADRVRATVHPDDGGALRDLTVAGRAVLASTPWTTVGKEEGPARTEQDWVARWHGGWQPCFPNAGPATAGVDPPQGFHGNASQAPWTLLSSGDDTAELAWADAAGLGSRRRWTLRPGGAELSASATNDGDQARPIVLAEHLILGSDLLTTLLDGPATLELPAGAVVEELAYDGTPTGRRDHWPGDRAAVDASIPARVFAVRDVTVAAVTCPAATVRLSWRGAAVPHLLVWQEFARSAEPPWNGETYAFGLEPTSTAHGAGLGAGHGAVVLAPGESMEWSVSLEVEWRDVRS
ncbi:hypothetical protein [Jiangella anatolica]|uniref:Aldose epimerase n=1 Tax=Jiangella anatolica TaxID=2670374 RepID=A0A2W2BGV7_9ACTN|nr:hypothetical protein [Jiangella anatolica]PZF79538.1 hypothetical protein C1I92_30670 [Jiangella anatolica]